MRAEVAVHCADAAAVHIVHCDGHCVVAWKPAGLLSVPGRGTGSGACLSSRVQQQVDGARIVHRLDMATSGLIVFARGVEAQRSLSRAFAERRVEKRYEAVVDGQVAFEAGTIDLPLQADWPNRPMQRVDVLQGKPSLTHYRVLARDPQCGATRLELQPFTGRSHQLRVHLMAIGHPIVGDALYAPPAVQARSTRLLLHATVLSFAHPSTGAPLRFESSAPF